MKKKSFLLLSTLILYAFYAHSQSYTLLVEGAIQGKFKGESVRAKFTDKTDLLGYIMEVSKSADATGRATGRRLYEPITVLKETGASSPQFLQALHTNEILKKVVIDFYKTNDKGILFNYYSVTLTNATISSFKQFTGALDKERFNPSDNLLCDEIKFTFQTISVVEKTYNITTEDSPAIK